MLSAEAQSVWRSEKTRLLSALCGRTRNGTVKTKNIPTLLTALCRLAPFSGAYAAEKPNIIFVLADDLG
jgi:hypothetical protein